MAFPTPLLDQKLAQIRQQSEGDRLRLLQSSLDWLHENAAWFGIEQGFVFGSVTQLGRFSPHSDIDIAVEDFKQGDPFGLGSYLSLQVDREVDVVPLDQCHFADKIRQTGIQWTSSKSQA